MALMIPKVEWASLLGAADTISHQQLHLVEVPRQPMEGYGERGDLSQKGAPRASGGGHARGHLAMPGVRTSVPHQPWNPQHAAE
ncbi:hypothetical protein SUZIE_200790 [Sciurus carolinensis]|uniref:Uncharacterized protein n=1 Tax=Sciurus carolinensis TaxID=30640 RepID=A0AA41T9N9_SCICA|nr:hypothetical protein [Sciurus carolinensis]